MKPLSSEHTAIQLLLPSVPRLPLPKSHAALTKTALPYTAFARCFTSSPGRAIGDIPHSEQPVHENQECPLFRRTHADMHAARARCLGPADELEIIEGTSSDCGDWGRFVFDTQTHGLDWGSISQRLGMYPPACGWDADECNHLPDAVNQVGVVVLARSVARAEWRAPPFPITRISRPSISASRARRRASARLAVELLYTP